MDFVRDIVPYFKPAAVIFGAHLIYYLTGNFLIMIFIGNLQMILSHFTSGEENYDQQNISKKNEKTF